MTSTCIQWVCLVYLSFKMLFVSIFLLVTAPRYVLIAMQQEYCSHILTSLSNLSPLSRFSYKALLWSFYSTEQKLSVPVIIQDKAQTCLKDFCNLLPAYLSSLTSISLYKLYSESKLSSHYPLDKSSLFWLLLFIPPRRTFFMLPSSVKSNLSVAAKSF